MLLLNIILRFKNVETKDITELSVLPRYFMRGIMRGKRIIPSIVRRWITRIMCDEQELVQRYFGSTSICSEHFTTKTRGRHKNWTCFSHYSHNGMIGSNPKNSGRRKHGERYFGSTSIWSEHFTTKTRGWHKNWTCFSHYSHHGMIGSNPKNSGRRKHGDGIRTEHISSTIHAFAQFGSILKLRTTKTRRWHKNRTCFGQDSHLAWLEAILKFWTTKTRGWHKN